MQKFNGYEMKICDICNSVSLHRKTKVYETDPVETEICMFCGSLRADEKGLTYLDNNDIMSEIIEEEGY